MRLLWSDIYLMCWNTYIYTWSRHAFTLIRYLSDVLKHLHLHLVTSCVYSDPISIWCVETLTFTPGHVMRLLWSDIYLMCWNTYIYTWSRHAFTLIRYLSDVLKHLHLHLVTSCVYSDPISIWCVETLTFTPGHVMRLLWSDIYLMCWNIYIYTWSRHAFTLIRYLSDVLKHLHLHLVTSCVYSDPISIWCVETLTFTPGHVMRLLWSDIYLMCWNTYIYTWSRHAFTLIRYLSDVLKHLHLHLVTSCVYSDPISIWCVETFTFTPGHVMRLLWSDIYLMCWNIYIYTWSRHAFTLIRYLSDVLKHLHLHLVTSCVYSDPISIWCVETLTFTPGHVMRLLWSDIYLMCWNTYIYTWSRHAFTLIRYLSDVLKHLHLHLVTSCVYSDPISIWCVETLTFTPGHVMRLLWSDIYLMCWNTYIYTWSRHAFTLIRYLSDVLKTLTLTPGHVMRLLWSDIYLMCWNTYIYTWSLHAFTLIRYLSDVLKHLHLHLVTSCVYSDPISIWCVETFTFTPGHFMRLLWSDIYLMCWNTYIYTWSLHAFTLIRYLSDVLKHLHLHLVTSCVYSDPISIWCVETFTFTPGHFMRLLWSDIYLMCWNIYIYTWSLHAFTLIRYLSDVLKHLHLHLVTSCVYSDPISIWCVETFTFTPGHVMRLLWSDIYLMCWNIYIYTWSRHAFTLIRYLSDVLKHLHLHLVTSCVYSDPISIWCVETFTFTPGHVMRLLWSDIYLMCWNTYIYTWSRHAFTLIRYLSDVLKHLHLVTSCVYSDPISIWCVETLTFTPGHVMRLLWSDIYLMCWNTYIYTWSRHAFTLIRYLSDVLKHLHLHLVTSCVYSDPISIWCVETLTFTPGHVMRLLWSDIYLMCWNTYIYTWSRHAFTLIRYLSDVLKHLHLHLVTSCVYSDPISIWCVETLTFTPGHVMRLLWSDIYLMCWNIYIYTWSRHAFTLIRYLSDVLKHLHLHLVTSCVYSDPISIWCVETLTFTPGHVMRLLWSDIYLMCWNIYIYTWSRHAFTLIRYLSDVLKHLHLHLVTSCVYSDPISIWCVETFTFTPGHVMRLLWSDIYLMCWNTYIYTWSLHAFTLIRYLSDVLKHLHLHLVTSCVYSDPISIWCVETLTFTPGHVMRLLWSDIYLMCWNTYIYTWSRHAFTLIRYLSDVLKHLHLHLVTSCVYSDPISIWCVETLTFTPGHVMRLLWSDIYLMCWNISIYTWSRHAFTLIRYLSDVLKHLHLHLVTSCVYSDPISIWCVETLTFTPGHFMRLLWSDIYLMCWNIYTWPHKCLRKTDRNPFFSSRAIFKLTSTKSKDKRCILFGSYLV